MNGITKITVGCQLALAICGTVWAGSLDEGLWGRWDFDKVAGARIMDSSGNGNDAFVSDKVKIAANTFGDKRGRVAEFRQAAGGSSFVAPGIKGEVKAFSVIFWLYPLNDGGFSQGVGATSWGQFNFHLSEGNGSVYVGTDVQTRFIPRDLPAVVKTNQWQMFAFTYENFTGRFYRNGRLLGEKHVSAPLPWGGFLVNSQVDGYVGDLCVYKRALSGQELERLYGSGRGKYGAAAVDVWLDDSADGYFAGGADMRLSASLPTAGGPWLVRTEILDVENHSLGREEHELGGMARTLTLKVPARHGVYWLKVAVIDKESCEVLRQELPFASVVTLPPTKDISADGAPLGVCHMDEQTWRCGRVLGVKWNRLWVPWARWPFIEPQPGKLSWEVLDRKIDAARAAGDELLLTIHGVPDWAAVKPNPSSHAYQTCMPRELAEWKKFVAAVVGRYKGKVRYFDLWNEPLRPGCGIRSERDTAHDYLALLKAAHEAAKAANPDAMIVGVNDHPSAWIEYPDGSKRPDGFEEVFKLGRLKDMEVVSCHDYNMDNPNDYYRKNGYVARIREQIMRYAGKPMPLWDTEVSFTSPPRRNDRPMTEKDFEAEFGGRFNPGGNKCYNDEGGILEAPERRSACWEIQAALLSFAQGAEKRFFFVEMYNADMTPVNEKGVAIAALASVLGDFRQWRGIAPLEGAAGNVNGVLLRRDEGGNVLAVWSASLRSEPLTLQTGDDGKEYLGLDFLGNPTPVGKSQDGVLKLEVGIEPLYIKGAPDKVRALNFAALSWGSEVISAERPAHGALTAFNPLDRKLSVGVKAAAPAGVVVEGLPGSLDLAPGQKAELSFVLKATGDGKGVLDISLVDNACGAPLASFAVEYLARQPLRLKKSLQPVKLDGDGDEWADIPWNEAKDYVGVVVGKTRTGVPESTYGHWLGAEDLSFRTKFAWDGDGVAFLIDVTDGLDKPLVCPEPSFAKEPWNYDCANLYVDFGAAKDGAKNASQVILVPTLERVPRPCAALVAYSPLCTDKKFRVTAVGKKTDKGYAIEGRITPPQGFTLAPGARLGLDVGIDDRDDMRGVRKTQMLQFGRSNTNQSRPFDWGVFEAAE